MIYGDAELYNVVELIPPEDGVGTLLSRVPNALRMSSNEKVRGCALFAGGCEIRFNLEGESARIVLQREPEPVVPAMAEVLQGAFVLPWCWYRIDTEPTEIRVSAPQDRDVFRRITRENHLSFDAGLTRVILPYEPPVRLIAIEGDISPPRPSQTPRTKLLAYGSSITHGHLATTPTGTYAMRTAHLLGADLINLGFGGGGLCEPEMAGYIAQRDDWDFATLELGINLVNQCETEEFATKAERFVARIVDAHPDKWVFCIDLFTCRWDLEPTSKQHDEFRQVVEGVVRKLDRPRLIHVRGREMLKDVSGLTSDLVHPSQSGMEEIAFHLAGFMREKMS